MTRTDIALIATSVLLASASYHFWQQLHREPSGNQTLRGSAAISAPASPAHPSAPSIDSIEKKGGTSGSNRTPGPEVQDDGENARVLNALLSDPHRRAALKEVNKRVAKMHHPDLRLYIPMTRETEDALLSLLAEQSLEEAAVNESRLPTEQILRRREATYRRLEENVSALLGPETFARWSAYQKAAALRSAVSGFRDSLSGADMLTDEKARALYSALIDEGVRYMEQELSVSEPPTDMSLLGQWSLQQEQRTHALAKDVAAPFLSSRQRKLLEELLDERLESLREGINTQMARRP